ncbi:hypothetical protein, partial [Burkholderia ubonensis]|uniref:hypothetical protein n=1 Tax=Burkholderia ubonensis TaxID=101571 RepID=UPI001E2B10CD
MTQDFPCHGHQSGSRKSVRASHDAGVVRNLSAFLWVRRLNKSLATRLREPLTEQDSKLVHGGFPVEGRP